MDVIALLAARGGTVLAFLSRAWEIECHVTQRHEVGAADERRGTVTAW